MSYFLRKYLNAFLFTLMITLIAYGVWMLVSDDKPEDSPLVISEPERKKQLPESAPERPKRDFVKTELALREGGGEEHQEALELMDQVSREQMRLSSKDAEKLLSFITSEKPEDIHIEDWHHRVNTVLNALRVQDDVVGLSEALIKMTTENPDEILRVYAMQHLRFRYEKAPDSEDLLEVMKEYAQRAEDVTSATALLGLHELEQAGKAEVEREFLLAQTREIINKGDLENKITAMHVAGEQAFSELLPEIQVMVLSNQTDSMLRRSAMYVLGETGNAETLNVLKSLKIEEDSGLQKVLEAAKEKLSEK